MIEKVNSALLELQGALLARSLYPEDHPRIRNGERQASAMLNEILSRREEITVFVVDDRVILEDQLLPSGANLATGLFRRLRDGGVDRITLRRGLDEGEIRGLLDSLTPHGERDGQPAPRTGPHVTFGYIDQAEARSERPARAPEPGSVPLPGQLASVLQHVWQEIEDAETLKRGEVGDILSCISRALSDSAGALLPLAPLKRHDEYTFVHTINVAILSTALSESLGFTSRDVYELSLAALLHDVGKRIIPLELLNKAGRFTDEEFRIVQLHPVEGARMLLSIPGMPGLAPIVAYEHHVRADGNGYPKLPRRWRLSLASRIVQVADVFDALRTHRPYRPALPVSEIVSMMRKDAGLFFDADMLEVFFEHVVSRGFPEPAEIAV